MLCDGASFRDFTQLALLNSYNNYNTTTHRALPNTGQTLPQKGIVNFN